MKTVHINAGNNGNGYDVLIGSGLLPETGKYARRVLKADRLAIFTDSTVDRLYADMVQESLEAEGFEVCRYVFPAGEESKNLSNIAPFLEFMARHHLTRKDAVVAIGGGVTGDMGGFAASIYLRGIDFIQIPTTLLAAVDSSVGGKTGVDIASGKNLVGSFWQPALVLCDMICFETLTEGMILDGTAEILKTGAIRDAALFDRAADGDIMEDAQEIISRCVQLKGSVVDADEKESGLRQILNFGHTMGHAIETHSAYSMSHGRAVAIGMLLVTRASEKKGLTEKGVYDRLLEVISSKGFETAYDARLEDLCRLASNDKKTAGDSISLIYIPKLGEAAATKVKIDRLHDFLR